MRRTKMQPLTSDEQELVDDYLARGDAYAIVRSQWPAMFRACRAAGLDEDDIRQAGMMGVIRAAQRFDPARAVQFSTYANWFVRSYVGRAAAKFGDRRLGRIRSGDAQHGRSRRSSLWEQLADRVRAEEGAEASERRRVLRDRVRGVLKMLTPRERQVVEMFYGLADPLLPNAIQDIAAALGVSKQRASQLKCRAMARISIPLQLACFDLVET